jgi:hypothetical protein
MTPTQQALEAIAVALHTTMNDPRLWDIYVHWGDLYVPLVTALEILSSRLTRFQAESTDWITDPHTGEPIEVQTEWCERGDFIQVIIDGNFRLRTH